MVDTLRRTFLTGAAGTLGAAVGAPALAAAIVPDASPPRAAATRTVRLLSTYVAGAAYYDAPRLVQRIVPGDRVVLRREPGNTYDRRAIEIRTADGAKLGYVPRIDNQALANLMDAGIQQPRAQILTVVPDERWPEIRVDVLVTLDVGQPAG